MKKRMIAFVLLVAATLTPAFGQNAQSWIKLSQYGTFSWQREIAYDITEKDPALDLLSVTIEPVEPASGDWSCGITPSTAAWSDGTVQLKAELRNCVYDDHAGAKNLHVATVRLYAGTSSEPYSDLLATFDVVMDIPYYFEAAWGQGGRPVTAYWLTTHVPEDPVLTFHVGGGPTDPGYVFTGWVGQAVDLGCVLQNPDDPERWWFDWHRYFLELGMTKQAYIAATFALEGNTEVGEDVVVELEADDVLLAIQFDTVVEPGHTEVLTSAPALDPPANFRFGRPPAYYDITTTAEFEGTITICITYNPDTFQGSLSRLRLFHYENGAWVDCTTYIDVENYIVCGEVDSLSPFAICEPYITPVEIAIKPGEGAGPAPINPNSRGTIPVAILGSADLDVTEIDPLSLSLEGLSVRVLPNGRVQCSIEDVNGDGYLDLVCQFVNDPGVWSEEMTTATLTGLLNDGTRIEGYDAIRLVR